MLINKDTYIKSAAELVSVDRFRCCLTTANIGISILILLIFASIYYGVQKGLLWLVGIANILTIAFQLGCLFAWAWTLIRLFKDVKNSDKLLPNKGVFIFHGLLLTVYLTLFALYYSAFYAHNHTEN